MTNPDGPTPPVTTAQLERVRTLAVHYMRECSDDPPLSTAEQALALALAGAMPSDAREMYGDSPQAHLAWVVASCWFLRVVHPESPRLAAAPLYDELDGLEAHAPGEWVVTYSAVREVLRQHGIDPRDGDGT